MYSFLTFTSVKGLRNMERLVNRRYKVFHGGKGYWEIQDTKTNGFWVLSTRDEVRKVIRLSFEKIRTLPENNGYELNPFRWLLP